MLLRLATTILLLLGVCNCTAYDAIIPVLCGGRCTAYVAEINHCNYFGLGFKTLNGKPLCSRVQNPISICFAMSCKCSCKNVRVD